LTTFICCGCAYGCVPITLRPIMPTKLVEFCDKSGQVSADMWWWNEVIEAVDPCNICKRCLTTFICCGCPYGCVPTTLRPLMPTKLVEFCDKSGQVSADMWWWNEVIEAVDPCYICKSCLTTFICCGCAYGCVPTTLWPLMLTKLVEFCYKSGQVSADMWWWNEVIEAVDPCCICKRCLTTFICCGCAYGCVPTTLRPLMLTKLVEFCHKTGQVSADMWWWNEVNEAVDPTHIHLTSILYM